MRDATLTPNDTDKRIIWTTQEDLTPIGAAKQFCNTHWAEPRKAVNYRMLGNGSWGCTFRVAGGLRTYRVFLADRNTIAVNVEAE